MRLTATDKAIGELNMRKADIERASAYIDKANGRADEGASLIASDLADIDRCITLLRVVAPPPKPEKASKPRAPRKSKKSADTE